VRPSETSPVRFRTCDVYSTEKAPASNRHLAIFGAICACILASGVFAQLHATGGSLDAAHTGIVPLYATTMFSEWFLLYFTWRGMRASGNDLFALAGRWTTVSGAALDVAYGLLVAGGFLLADAGVQHLVPAGNAKSIDQLLPRGPVEVALWIAVSVTAGVVEELVFRGYLLGQLSARFHNVPLALVAQGLWFGGMHAYEGPQAVVSICAIGIGFGLVALWRKQLRTNIIAHSAVDLVAGLAPRLFG
jgi:membrane protease YdiL (CAAX protease family)